MRQSVETHSILLDILMFCGGPNASFAAVKPQSGRRHFAEPLSSADSIVSATLERIAFKGIGDYGRQHGHDAHCACSVCGVDIKLGIVVAEPTPRASFIFLGVSALRL